MVIHESCRLHESVADCAPTKRKSPLFHVLAHGIRLRTRRLPVLRILDIPDDALSIHERPDIPVKGTELFGNRKVGLRILHRTMDLHLISDDPRILHELRKLFFCIVADGNRVEVVESLPEILTLAQDCAPGQSCLEGIQDQELEKLQVIMEFHTPLVVMIFSLHRITRPGAVSLNRLLDQVRFFLHSISPFWFLTF